MFNQRFIANRITFNILFFPNGFLSIIAFIMSGSGYQRSEFA